jgi:hypothetical protein
MNQTYVDHKASEWEGYYAYFLVQESSIAQGKIYYEPNLCRSQGIGMRRILCLLLGARTLNSTR